MVDRFTKLAVLVRDQTEQDDQFRIDERHLFEEIKRGACLDFLDARSAIARRPALADVRDEKIGARKSGVCQHVVEEFSGIADKRPAAFVFLPPRRFADDQVLGRKARIYEPAPGTA